MKSNAMRWLATLVAAAATTTTTVVPSSLRADEPGPVRAANAPTTPAAPPAESERVTKRDSYPFRGIVASFDAESRLLKLEGREKQRVLYVTDQTRLNRDGQPAVLADLKAGDALGGTVRRTSDGREEAVMIRIGPKPEPTSGRASTSKASRKRGATGE